TTVPGPAHRRQGLPPEIRLLSALGTAGRLALGCSARPHLVLGLPATPLVHYQASPPPAPLARCPVPANRWAGRRCLTARSGAVSPRASATRSFGLLGRQALARQWCQQGQGRRLWPWCRLQSERL